jgi:hypothetical protein
MKSSWLNGAADKRVAWAAGVHVSLGAAADSCHWQDNQVENAEIYRSNGAPLRVGLRIANGAL